MGLYMNLVECCTNYVADANSTIMQYTIQTHHIYTNNKCTNKTKHSRIRNNTKINKLYLIAGYPNLAHYATPDAPKFVNVPPCNNNKLW